MAFTYKFCHMAKFKLLALFITWLIFYYYNSMNMNMGIYQPALCVLGTFIFSDLLVFGFHNYNWGDYESKIPIS
jgi:hypothetical protein